MIKLLKNPWIVSNAGNLLIGMAGVVTSIMISRGLGPIGRGILTEGMLWPTLILTLGGAASVQSFIYHWAKADSSESRTSVVTSGLILTLLSSVVLIGVSFVACYMALGIQDKPSFRLAVIYCFTIPLSLFAGLFTSFPLADKRFGAYWGQRLIYQLLYATGLVMLWSGAVFRADYIVLVSIAALSMSCIFAIGYHVTQYGVEFRFNGKTMSAMSAYGIRTNMVSLPYHLNVRLDQLLMSMMLPVDVLGYYATAFAWATLSSFITGGIPSVLISRSASIGADKADAKLLVDQFRLVTIVVAAVGVVFSLLAPIGIPLLFGMNFSPAIIPAMILCVANIFLNLNLSLHEIIRGAGLPSLGIKPEYAGLAVNIVLLLLLLWKWGGVGAAIASLVSYATTYFSLLYVFSRQANIPGSLYSLPQKKDFALLLQNIRVQLALFKS